MMTKVSDIRFSQAPSFEPTTLARELGDKAPDTLQSAQAPVEQGEGFFKRMICCVPRCILAFVQKFICLLTLGCCCNTKNLTEKERREIVLFDLAKLLRVWASGTHEQKKAASEEIFSKYPELKEDIAVFGVIDYRRSYLGHANTKEPTTPEGRRKREKEINDYNATHFDAEKKRFLGKLDSYDAQFIQNYIEHLRIQQDHS